MTISSIAAAHPYPAAVQLPEPTELRVGGLVLRPPQPADAPRALAMLQDPDVALWNEAPDVVDLETAEAWCARGADWSSGTHATFSVLDSTGDLVGNVSLFAIDQANDVAKIGYRIAPWARRRGVATKATRTVAEWAIEELGVVRVELFHAVENPASCGVALAAGFELEGVLRAAHVYPDGVRRDEHLHARVATMAT